MHPSLHSTRTVPFSCCDTNEHSISVRGALSILHVVEARAYLSVEDKEPFLRASALLPELICWRGPLTQKRRQVIDLAAFILVAGRGFEPLTFRL